MKTTELKLTEIKNNLLIAKFMDLEKLNKHYYLYPQINENDPLFVHYKQLKYHTEWNWLIPVVREVLTLIDLNEFNFDSNALKFEVLDNDIKQAHKEVIEFIKEYNKKN